MNWKTYIHSNPKILLGKPVIKGTRLSVEFILGLFSEGWTQQQVLESYPTLNAEAIQAGERICRRVTTFGWFNLRKQTRELFYMLVFLLVYQSVR